jgi:hypothetical protein
MNVPKNPRLTLLGGDGPHRAPRRVGGLDPIAYRGCTDLRRLTTRSKAESSLRSRLYGRPSRSIPYFRIQLRLGKRIRDGRVVKDVSCTAAELIIRIISV